MTLERAAQSAPEAIIRLIQEFNDAFNRRDVDAIMEAMTEDCLFENTFPPPDGSRHQGQAEVRAVWEELFKSSPQARFDIEELFAGDDRCVMRWAYHWVDRNGKPGHIRGVDIFRVRDGKVAEKFSYVKG